MFVLKTTHLDFDSKKEDSCLVVLFLTNDYIFDTKLAWVFMEKIKSRTVKKG